MNNENYMDLISMMQECMVSGNYVAVAETAKKAIKLDPRQRQAYVLLGNAYANLEKYDEALLSLRNLLMINSKDGEAYFLIGNVYLLMDDKLKAVESYNKSSEFGYNNVEMYKALAFIFLDAGDITQSLRNINKAIELAPLDGELRLAKTRIYLEQSRFDEALQTLDDMEAILPDSFESYAYRAQIYTSQKKYQKAIDLLSRAVQRFPQDTDVLILKIKVYMESGKDVEAKQLISKLDRTQLTDIGVKNLAVIEATYAIKDNDILKAKSVLREAIQKKSDNDLMFALFQLDAKTNEPEEAKKLAAVLQDSQKNDLYFVTSKYYLAERMLEDGKEIEAREVFKKLTSEFRQLTIKRPGFYQGYIYRLLCHVQIREYDEALSLCDYLESVNPNSGDSHAFRSVVYHAMGKETEAGSEREMAKKLNINYSF